MQLRRRLISNDQFQNDYRGFITEIIESGYAEQVPVEEISEDTKQVWYIPHPGVYHKKKPGKIWAVFDCSAVYNSHLISNFFKVQTWQTTSLGYCVDFAKRNLPWCVTFRQCLIKSRSTQSSVIISDSCGWTMKGLKEILQSTLWQLTFLAPPHHLAAQTSHWRQPQTAISTVWQRHGRIHRKEFLCRRQTQVGIFRRARKAADLKHHITVSQRSP